MSALESEHAACPHRSCALSIITSHRWKLRSVSADACVRACGSDTVTPWTVQSVSDSYHRNFTGSDIQKPLTVQRPLDSNHQNFIPT